VGRQFQTCRAWSDRGDVERSGAGKNPEARRKTQTDLLSTAFSQLWK
jgi:hypothetical protein